MATEETLLRCLPNAHRECIDIFVELIEQSNGLDDHVIHTIDIELDFGTGIGVAETQLSFVLILIGQALHQLREMKTKTWGRTQISDLFRSREISPRSSSGTTPVC